MTRNFSRIPIGNLRSSQLCLVGRSCLQCWIIDSNDFRILSACLILYILFLNILFMVVDFLTMSGTIVERKSEDRPLEKSPKYMLNIFCNRPTILQNVHTWMNLWFWRRKLTQENTNDVFTNWNWAKTDLIGVKSVGKVSLKNSKSSLI